ncbi:MAG: hypothetical protein IJA66_04060 [Alistipes sp.]|nr:hypothetical protein [Alistipes sp.]
MKPLFNRKTIRFVALILFCSTTTLLFSQERLPVLLDNTPFVVASSIDLGSDKNFNWEYFNKYQDARNFKKDWPAITIPKGVVVNVLAHLDEMSHVELPDGSIGYIPTVAVAYREMSFTLDADSRVKISTSRYADKMILYPKGRYILQEVKGLEYNRGKYSEWCYEYHPDYIFQHETGSCFKINIGYSSWSWRDATKRPDIFANFYANHPAIKKISASELNFVKFELEGNVVPTNLIGCSRSYIESVLGRPSAYVGPATSPYKDYTYSIHTNVGWESGSRSSRRFFCAGLRIFYDKNQIAVYMDKRPIGLFDRRDNGVVKLYLPHKAVASMLPDITERIAASKHGGTLVYRKQSEEHKELYSAPSLFYRCCIKIVYLFENGFGLNNQWVIFAILLVLILVSMSLVCAFVRYCLPFSNRMLKILCGVLNLPISVFVVFYVTRFHLLGAVFAILCVITIEYVCILAFFQRINSNRCDNCRRFLEKPILVNEEHCLIQIGKPYVAESDGVFLRRWTDVKYKDSRVTKNRVSTYNHKTSVVLTKPIIQTLKCPLCGHTWKFTRYEHETVIGPIRYCEQVDPLYIDYKTEITREQIKDRQTGQVLHEEEVDRRDFTTTSSGSRYIRYKSYDYERYKPYIHRYINGDHKALIEYEQMYYGEFWG